MLKAYFEQGSRDADKLLKKLEGEAKREAVDYNMKAQVIAKRRKTAIR